MEWGRKNITITRGILKNMTMALRKYNDFREKFLRYSHKGKLTSKQKETWENKRLQINRKFWDKYGPYYDRLAFDFSTEADQMTEENTIVGFDLDYIQAIRPFKYHSKKVGVDGEPIVRTLDGWDLWLDFVKEVTRFMIREHYPWGEKLGRKEISDKMWREIRAEYKEYKRLAGKKVNREKFYEGIKGKYDKKYKPLLPGTRDPVPREERFWVKLYSKN